MKTFDEVYQTVTANGMRELTYERSKQIAVEYASQFIDKAAEIADTTLGDYHSVRPQHPYFTGIFFSKVKEVYCD